MKNKRKGIILAASILGTLAVVSSGFAAWVIVQNGDVTKEGTVSVDTVEDQRHAITIEETPAPDYNIFIGGVPSDYQEGSHTSEDFSKTGTAWLQVDDTSKKEDLSASFTVKVGNYATAALSVDVKIATKKSGEEGFNEAVSIDDLSDLIGADKYLTYTLTGGTNGNAMEAETAKIELKFSWAGKFGNVNPLRYYNADDKTVGEYGNTAAEDLAAIQALEGAKFTITVTATHKPAGN